MKSKDVFIVGLMGGVIGFLIAQLAGAVLGFLIGLIIGEHLRGK